MTETKLTKRIGSIVPLEAYECIPEHCRDSVKAYVEMGQPVGDFLQAVITNNLVESFARADDINTQRLVDYARFFWNDAPRDCWGSRESYQRWIEDHRKERNGE